jgi:hypothetical protein
LDDGSGTGKHAIAWDGIGDTLVPHPAADFDFYPFTDANGWEMKTVAIDIKPGEFPNSINPRQKGKIAVAILTMPAFDIAAVDPTAIFFGANGAGAAPVHVATEDVDGDGDLDLILQFNAGSKTSPGVSWPLLPDCLGPDGHSISATALRPVGDWRRASAPGTGAGLNAIDGELRGEGGPGAARLKPFEGAHGKARALPYRSRCEGRRGAAPQLCTAGTQSQPRCRKAARSCLSHGTAWCRTVWGGGDDGHMSGDN